MSFSLCFPVCVGGRLTYSSTLGCCDPSENRALSKVSALNAVCHCTSKSLHNARNIRTLDSDLQKGLDSQSWTRPWNALHVLWTWKGPLLTLVIFPNWSASLLFQQSSLDSRLSHGHVFSGYFNFCLSYTVLIKETSFITL